MAKVTDSLYNAQLEWAEDFGFPQCEACSHFGFDGTCKAFPDGIPIDILGGVHDHREPYPGDNGIRFEQASEQHPDRQKRG